jgi:hypothetical protein
METTMPDLKTALQSALNEWNQPETTTVQTTTPSHHALAAVEQRPEGTRYFSRTTDVSRSTFEYVRDNPHRVTREVVAALSAHGHNPSSVSSILSQMARTGLITRESDGTYWTHAREYTPVKLSALRRDRKATKPKAAKPKTVQPKVEAPKAEAPKVEAPKPTVVLTRKEAAPAPALRVVNSIDELIDQLTVRQAIDLFNKLKGMLA